MIQLQRNPLPSPQSDAIKKWLDMPGAFEFQKYIASISAEATAEAGNCLLSDEPDAKDSMEDNLTTARALDGLNKLIDEMRAPEYKFEVAALKPKTILETKNPS